jgi:outer membrane protease
MKNITALAFLVIINCAFICINPLFSQGYGNGRYVFLVSTQTGIVYGQALEYVYPVQGQTKSELYSELRWDMKPVFYLGLQLDYELADIMRRLGFFSSVSLKAGIPKDSGVMEDRDWFSTENTALTNFSSHTNRTNSFFSLDASAGISLPIRSIFCIKPFLSVSWMHFSFTGRDGYYEYARSVPGYPGKYYPINDDPEKWPLSGDVINYKQNWFLAAAGFSVTTNVFAPFSVDLSLQISPLTYCIALDEHILRGKFFYDYTSMGLFFEPKLNLAFNMNRIDLMLNTAYRRIGKTRGKTYEKEKNTLSEIIQNESGAGLSIFDMCFLVRINIGNR